ncbi:hypothetical protein AAFF_G00434380 [Aldrovandia affinis]|uniref:Uncharacterized protein n=1 Tax=Aldrovandia affinis TaxID=143900 RepID=A0AAD7S869_9TELE|nr:hypothetical protein AAFF_G00434380 [Aldrovandia affinis]
MKYCTAPDVKGQHAREREASPAARLNRLCPLHHPARPPFPSTRTPPNIVPELTLCRNLIRISARPNTLTPAAH